MTTYYAVTENGPTHGFLVLQYSQNYRDMVEEYAAQCKKFCGDYEFGLVKVEILSVDCDLQADVDGTVRVAVQALINEAHTESVYYVQTTDGKYSTELGCWITTPESGEDMDFTEAQALIFECVSIAEEAEEHIS